MHQPVKPPVEPADIREQLTARVSSEVLDLLRRAGVLGDRLGYVVCLAGGIVRDVLIDAPNCDVDLLVEGDGPALAEALARDLGGVLVRHSRFHTATLRLSTATLKVDVATARREYYDCSGALPRVETATLREDLLRRDFTVNAMAICLNRERFGMLIDYFHGYQDLQAGLIRVLHDRSFVEDPTRILRAVRFAQRFGLMIAPGTASLAAAPEALAALELLSGPRLWAELSRLLEEENPWPAIRRLDALGVWARVFPGVSTGEGWRKAAERVCGLVREWETVPGQNCRLLRAAACLAAILGSCSEGGTTAMAFGRRFNLKKKELAILRQTGHTVGILAASAGGRLTPGRWHRLLRDQPAESVLAGLAIHGKEKMTSQVMVYLRGRQQLARLVSGDDLRAMGQTPGPLFAGVLLDLECAFLDGELRDREEALAWARTKLNRKGDQ